VHVGDIQVDKRFIENQRNDKNMRGDQKINKSKKFEATVVGPEAEKIANALCKGKDVYFEIHEKTIDGEPAVVFNGEIYPD
jgi:hypothetical protein